MALVVRAHVNGRQPQHPRSLQLGIGFVDLCVRKGNPGVLPGDQTQRGRKTDDLQPFGNDAIFRPADAGCHRRADDLPATRRHGGRPRLRVWIGCHDGEANFISLSARGAGLAGRGRGPPPPGCREGPSPRLHGGILIPRAVILSAAKNLA